MCILFLGISLEQPRTTSKMDDLLIDKIRKIKLIISDVDGILTDGSIFIGSDGTEFKQFTVEDGAGAAIARLAKLPVALISGRYSESTTIRAKEMKIEHCHQGKLDKIGSYEEICASYNVSSEQVLYIGDGYIDIPVMEMSGVAFTVPHAPSLVSDSADYITQTPGGKGAFRETVELVLKIQDRHKGVLDEMRKNIYKA